MRVLYAARIADCRPCPLGALCQEHGTSTKKPRRVSAVLHPLPQPVSEEHPPPCLSALIPSCGVIGRAVSLAAPGYEGLEATWSPWKPRPFLHPPRRRLLSRALSERIGV